ncbi:MAG: sensor histidine kinase [Flavobacteriales bacterium]
MQTVYRIKLIWKWLFLVSAIGIAIITFFYSNALIKELKIEEVKKVKIWAQANQRYVMSDDPERDQEEFKFLVSILQSNTTIPIIVYNEKTETIQQTLNIKDTDNKEDLLEQMKAMGKDYTPIEVRGNISEKATLDYKLLIYYTNSNLTDKLEILPIILLLTFSFFIGLAYWAFSESRKSEQSLVWAGMARETAHQIGTPLSSLLGWYELLKLYDVPEDNLIEIQKDLNRLQVITERFSKIGAQPGLNEENIVPVVRNAYQYIRKRASQKIEFDFNCEEENILANTNKELMSWVIENLIRNAVDAIQGPGRISVHLFAQKNKIYIDVTDTGKGIKATHFKTIFEPGYTTKTRGWGLGLSLVKRIIKNYHQGEIYVLKSDIDVGTTFRIILKQIQ